MSVPPAAAPLAERLAALARYCHGRGWALGTSGNFSVVTSREPLRLAITPSGADKGRVAGPDILEIDAAGTPTSGAGRPSAETALHLAVVRARGAGAVCHTHSLWATLLSERCAARGGLAIEGLEMLKGLSGVRSHAHREWLPVIANDQDWEAAVPGVERALADDPACHGFLIRGHGLYTWGRDLDEAQRHLEVLEFLIELLARQAGADALREGPWRS
jgi:methylthioribulose-1-phosphate dehydratase